MSRDVFSKEQPVTYDEEYNTGRRKSPGRGSFFSFTLEDEFTRAAFFRGRA
jgi:hypothetical protein